MFKLRHRRHFKDGNDVEWPVKRLQMVVPEESIEIDIEYSVEIK